MAKAAMKGKYQHHQWWDLYAMQPNASNKSEGQFVGINQGSNLDEDGEDEDDELEQEELPLGQKRNTENMWSNKRFHLLHHAVPSVLRKRDFITIFLLIVRNHDWFSFFFMPDLGNNRFMRWIGLCKSVLIGVFIDTLFFQAFYNNNGTCEAFVTQSTCEASINGATNAPTCLWQGSCSTLYCSDDGSTSSCSLRQPPANFNFTIMLALMCLIVGLPLDLLTSFVLDEYASKKPDWSYFHPVSTDSSATEKENCEEKPEGELTLSAVETTRSLDYLADLEQLKTTEEEVNAILLSVALHFQQCNAVHHSDNVHELEAWDQIKDARSHAIEEYFGVKPDGHCSRFTLLDWWLYGKPKAKLEMKIDSIREQALDIESTIKLIDGLDYNVREVALLNEFVLEQFTVIKRWILESQLNCFNNFLVPEVDCRMWLAAWAFVLLTMLFYVYWIFAW